MESTDDFRPALIEAGRHAMEKWCIELDKRVFGGENIMDKVNHPEHYNAGEIETIDVIKSTTNSMPLKPFNATLVGNVIKYVSRYKLKNGIEDLEKAEWYLKRLIEEEKGEEVETFFDYPTTLTCQTFAEALSKNHQSCIMSAIDAKSTLAEATPCCTDNGEYILCKDCYAMTVHDMLKNTGMGKRLREQFVMYIKNKK